MKIIERLYQYFDLKGIKPTSFEKNIGVSNGYFKKMLNRKADIGESVLINIIENSPDLSPIWLIFGKGEMIISNNSEYIIPKSTENNFLLDKICELSAKNAALEIEIKKLKKDKSKPYESVQHTIDITAEPKLDE
ncbi:MAG: hypothetical protein PHH37_08480 [Paludibacter sp.]|nr:hypothetical protein [Paludibacter sp.]